MGDQLMPWQLMPWHKTWIKDPEYDRVDLVKEGANSQAHIMLVKSKGGTNMTLEEILKAMKPEHREVVEAALEKAKEASKEQVQAAVEEAVAKAKQEQPAPAGASEEEILKSVKDPALRQLLETQIAKAKAAEAEVLKIKKAEAEREAIAKAKEVPNLGVEENQLATLYKQLKDADNSLAEEVFGIFKSLNEVIKDSAIMKEAGVAGDPAGATSEAAAWAAIEQAAEPLMKEKNISQHQAITEVINARPELYSAYLKAQRGL